MRAMRMVFHSWRRPSATFLRGSPSSGSSERRYQGVWPKKVMIFRIKTNFNERILSMRLTEKPRIASITGQVSHLRKHHAWARLSLLALFVILIVGNARTAAQWDNSAKHRASSIIYVSSGGGGITEVNSTNNSVIAT